MVFEKGCKASLAHENVVYMYLPGNEESDFRTICNFKKECKELIEKAFKKTVSIAKALRIERGIAIDEEEDKLLNGDKKGDELPPELNTQEKSREKIE